MCVCLLVSVGVNITLSMDGYELSQSRHFCPKKPIHEALCRVLGAM